MELAIAMLIAYVPFAWYWIGHWLIEARKTEAQKRTAARRKKKSNIIEWWEQ